MFWVILITAVLQKKKSLNFVISHNKKTSIFTTINGKLNIVIYRLMFDASNPFIAFAVIMYFGVKSC